MAKKVKKQHQDGKKRKVNKRKIFVFLVVLVLAALLIMFALKLNNNGNEPAAKKKIVDEIKDFDYKVSESDTKLFKKTFSELKQELSKDKVDNKKYAELIAKLYIIDFYTLSNKSNVNDVGSVQFVYSKFTKDFVDLARHGIYKQVNSNLDNNRKQNLPEVESVTVSSNEEVIPSALVSNEEFKSVTEPNSYEIKISWTYKSQTNFQKSATLLIVPDGDKLSVAKSY